MPLHSDAEKLLQRVDQLGAVRESTPTPASRDQGGGVAVTEPWQWRGRPDVTRRRHCLQPLQAQGSAVAPSAWSCHLHHSGSQRALVIVGYAHSIG